MSTATRPVATERQLMDAVVEAAQWLGWLCYHTWNSMHSVAGFPDAVMLRDDRCVVVEFKSVTGKLTPEQRNWLAAFRAAGCETYVVRPADQDWFLRDVLGGMV